VHHPKK
jgi:hypothetical protein